MSKYDIESTTIWADVKDIINSGLKPVVYEYQGIVHTEMEDIPVLKIKAVDTVRDYANNVGDHLQVEFIMSLGDYVSRLFPYRTNLEFTIKKILASTTDTSVKANTIISTDRYKGVFLVNENPKVTGTELEMIDTESLNKLDIPTVKLQLLDRSLEPLRIKTVDGIFRQVTARKVIHNLLGGESMKVKVDGKPSIDGIDIVDPDNTDARQHVTIPTGTLITNLPTYMQEHMGGVYSTGIGTYLQKFNNLKLWFVFPLFNTKRFDTSSDNKVIIYAVPQEKLQGIDRTYKEDGSTLRIVATANKKYEDSADIDYMNKGSGFRMADARAYLTKPVTITANGPVGDRGRLNFEVAAEARKDGLNYAPRVQGISSNPFKQFTAVTSRNVATVSFVWENSNADLLYPGMPCKYVYVDEGKTMELRGTVVHVHSLTALQGGGVNGKLYKSLASVTMLCEQKSKYRTMPTTEVTGNL